ncbi:protein kinase [Candidatus Uabimicrobium sp. HlEnr_7]|uniref:protein kinase domain-containing protein n=1 Tax=Candidatus Uabimicrobium helgolandensis TaxID=3095367 RepID=UPI00355892C1
MKEQDVKFGQIALGKNLINSKILTYCIHLQHSSPQKKLSDIFLENGYLSNQQVVEIHNQLKPQNTKQIGRYQILEEIGRGGMGVIYKARDTLSKNIVAVKILIHGSQENNARFLRESKATSRLQHPNIVRLHECGQEKGVHYFSMDFIGGKSLDDIVKGDALLSIRKTVHLMIKVCKAIHYAHEQGVIHRDLKPANIMLEDDEPKVMDFGLAKLHDASQKLSTSGAMIGTIYYMSPEQVLGRVGSIDARSDVYSLGGVLYTLLTGRAPFTGNSIPQVSKQILEKELVPPSNLKQIVPNVLDDICAKAMAKEKNQRYQSAAQLTVDLEKFLVGEKVDRAKSQNYKKISLWLKKHSIVLTVFFIIFSVTCALFFSAYNSLMKKYEALRAKSLQVRVPKRDNSSKKKMYLLYEQAIKYRNAGQDDLAIKEFSKAIAIDPSHVRSYVNRSSLYYKQRKWKEAVRDADKLLELDPFADTALYNKGVGYNNNGKTTKALKYLEKTVFLNPNSYGGWVVLGRIYTSQKKYERAKRVLENAIRVKRTQEAHFLLGLVEYRLNNMDAAINNYTLSIAFGNRSVEVFRNRSVCYLEKKDSAKAIEDIDKVIKITPRDHTLHNSKAYSLAKLGKFSLALSSVNDALRIRATPASLDTKGEIFNHMGKYDEALDIAQRSLRLAEQGDAYYNRAISYYMLGDYSRAKVNYLKALPLKKMATEEEYFEDIPKESALYLRRRRMKAFFAQIK